MPNLSDIETLGLEVMQLDDTGVVSVSLSATDGATVTLTWDEIACSVAIRWMDNDVERLRIEREAVSKVAVSEDGGIVKFQAWMSHGNIKGRLVVRVGQQVSVDDTILLT